MPYKMHRAQGDYRAMRGDPGLASFLKGAINKVGSVMSVLPGPIGAVGKFVSGATGSRPSPTSVAIPSRATSSFTGAQVGLGGISVGRTTTQSTMYSAQGFPAVAGEIPPRGYKLNKTGYFLKSGEWIPAHSRYVKVRTRNPANGKALRKAIGRTAAFNNTVKRARKNLRKLAKI